MKKSIIAWCLFDWANSAFPTLILTFLFATYFTQSVAQNPILGTVQWGRAIALSGVLIAIFSPILGMIADHEGRRKPWLAVLTALCILSSALLWYTRPTADDAFWALTWVVVGNLGFEVGMVFYNAMLSELIPRHYLGRLSGWGWGLGYTGGLSSLGLMLLILSYYPHQGLGLRITGPLVAAWMLIFAWPIFVWTPDRPSTGCSYQVALRKGFYSVYSVFRRWRQHRTVLLFLLARMFYIDGLNTVFAFGGIYAAGTMGMTFSEILKFGISMNLVAGLGAAILGWMDDKKGPKDTILLALLLMIICIIVLLTTHTQWIFWVFSMGLSLCVGPIQSASRSFLIRAAPANYITEFFGLYALSGRATNFLGPWVLAWVTLHFQSQRAGLSTVIVLLMIGGLLLYRVKEDQSFPANN